MIDGIRFRAGDNGTIVLQVRDPFSKDNTFSWNDRNELWRDAKVEDLLEVSAYARGEIAHRLEMMDMDLTTLRRAFHDAENGSLPA